MHSRVRRHVIGSHDKRLHRQQTADSDDRYQPEYLDERLTALPSSSTQHAHFANLDSTSIRGAR